MVQLTRFTFYHCRLVFLELPVVNAEAELLELLSAIALASRRLLFGHVIEWLANSFGGLALPTNRWFLAELVLDLDLIFFDHK